MSTPPVDALAPLRDALLRAARDEACAITGQAREQAREVVDEAAARAAGLRGQARRRGWAEGDAAGAAALARARGEARALVLAARREAYETLCTRLTGAAARILAEPATAGRLADLARLRLGADADLRPAPGGGVLAEAAGRRLDLGAAGIAAGVVDSLAPDLDERLAAPGEGRP